ncbi:GNAT family N-acetyltransferase [Pseudogracilibacillus auburnensis]|uniref:GNAT family N-acetyltransferase n=1 Tax=Pseudogracilibacillus auburnensis TaxID=1494959 RepID=UPI001A96CE2E|nr:GNAT family N-acetyltransferase [Pseudogracilibacillus auburnensis]MBO1002534.1 GNAT family N-acetyltransferase [Pseudogracilibacillus auburnensis]
MSAHVEIKQLTSIEQLNELVKIEKAVWQMPTIPVHQTFTAMNNGGVILGSYTSGKMVGFLYSFAGFNKEKPYLCSHMLGILPPYRKSGLGIEMKKKQAKIAKKMGYEMITWTFDPLESKNAYINLHKLGACGAHYKENHYGDLNDQLNQGLPTDRIQIEWDLITTTRKRTHVLDPEKLLLVMEEESPVYRTHCTDDLQKSDVWFVEIPNDFQSLKREQIELAKKWRFESRNVFQALFAAGFIAIDFISEQSNKSYYVFSMGV